MPGVRWLIALVLLAPSLRAQDGCNSVAAWNACDLVFELMPNERDRAVDTHAEFRSPHHKTYAMQAFRDGGRLVIRFAPTESGPWEYRISSNLQRLEGTMGQFTAGESDSPGFVKVANVHHFATENQKPHLWMSAPMENFASMPRTDFDRAVDQFAAEKFTHVRVTLDRGANLNEAAERIRAISAKGLTADLSLASIPPDAQERERYLRDLVPRFAAFNLTWAGMPAFEATPQARSILKDTGALLQKLDPYDHPRTSGANSTSAPMAPDGWMTVLSYGTADANVGAVEHQLYQVSSINTGIRNQKDLWNATMNGQYPASGSGEYMKAWFEFMSGNRYWELEPYFDVDGARAIALEGVEYIVYLEKPGPVELTVENHSYDIAWMNPATGEITKEKKNYKGEHFATEPPDRSHDWVLRVSREGHKEGMLKSYKFDSRPIPVQVVEQNPQKVPYEIAEPAVTEISLSRPPLYSVKAKRESRASRSVLVEWTADVVVDGEGYRVAGTGREGTLHIPEGLAKTFPAVVSLRMALLNANGKAYVVDKVYSLTR